MAFIPFDLDQAISSGANAGTNLALALRGVPYNQAVETLKARILANQLAEGLNPLQVENQRLQNDLNTGMNPLKLRLGQVEAAGAESGLPAIIAGNKVKTGQLENDLENMGEINLLTNLKRNAEKVGAQNLITKGEAEAPYIQPTAKAEGELSLARLNLLKNYFSGSANGTGSGLTPIKDSAGNIIKYQLFDPINSKMEYFSPAEIKTIQDQRGRPFVIGNDGAITPAKTPPGFSIKPEDASLSDAQRNSKLFADRLIKAESAYSSAFEQSGAFSSPASTLADFTEFLLPDSFTPEARQLLGQAEEDFLSAALRKESGASITPAEKKMAAKQYFPRPGDGPNVILQKMQNRLNETQGILKNAGYSDEQVAQAMQPLQAAYQATQAKLGIKGGGRTNTSEGANSGPVSGTIDGYSFKVKGQ